jgi:hypothetical protein
MPHGKIHLCTSLNCEKLLTVKLNDGCVPVVWLGKDDLVEHEHLSREEAELIKDEDMLETAGVAIDEIWDGCFGETFGTAVKSVAVHLEHSRLWNTPDDQLPLVDPTSIRDDANRRFFEERLKGKTKDEAFQISLQDSNHIYD